MAAATITNINTSFFTPSFTKYLLCTRQYVSLFNITTTLEVDSIYRSVSIDQQIKTQNVHTA